jgi:Family of unknown function (DUF6527)
MSATKVRLLPDAPNQSTARSQLEDPGDVSMVVRGRLRSIVMRCPDGCGDDITLNADTRVGPAWRVYRRKGLLTIHPSVWRTEGCRSHFIIWRGRIDWIGGRWNVAIEEDIIRVVADGLGDTPKAYWEIANSLDLLPWDVLAACHELVKRGFANEEPVGSGDFRLKESPTT